MEGDSTRTGEEVLIGRPYAEQKKTAKRGATVEKKNLG